MKGSLLAYIIEVATPMERPHSPNELILFEFRKKSITHWTSRVSYHLKEMYSPPLWPQAAKSKANTVIFKGSKYFKFGPTSQRGEEFPWR